MIATAGGAALLLWLPTAIASRIARLGHERLGLVVSVGSLELGSSSLELRGVRASSESGKGVELSAGRVVLRGSPWAVLWHGARGLDRVDAEHPAAELDVSSAAYAALAAKLRKASEPGASGATPSRGRSIHAVDLKLSVRDASHSLVRLTGGRLDLEGERIALSARQVSLGDPGFGAISGELTRVQVEASRSAGLRLRRFSVQQASFELAQVAPSPAGSTAEAAPDDLADDLPPAVTPAKPARAVPAKGARASAAPAPSSPAAAAPVAAQPAALPPSAAKPERLKALLARLAPGARLEVENADVQRRTATGTAPILRALHVEIALKEASEVDVRLHGAAVGGGHLEADLRLWPSELRADGNVALSTLPLTLIAPFLPAVPWYEPENSTLDAQLSVRAHPEGRLALSGRAALHDAALFSARLAPDAVRDLSLTLEGDGSFWPEQRRLEIAGGRLRLGKAKVDLHGSVELATDHYAYDLAADLPRTPCTDAVRAIPADLLGELSLAEWTGWLSGHVLLKVDSRELDKTVLNLDVTDRCEFVSVPAMADLRRFQEPFTQSVEEPDGTLFEMETGPGTEAWTPIDAISPYLIYAVLAHEDPQFFSHHGFSPAHIRDALVRNLREGRYVLGASTITMQLVKNVFLRREKTLARKIQEVLLTWWIERVLPKRDGLELYLNVIEYGPSIYGIRNAARHYFNRLPSELSPAESVFLATILPNPKHYHAFFERGALSPGWTAQMRQMMQRLRQRGFYTNEAADYGLQELEHFKFMPEGSAAEPRVIPGGTAPLSYAPGGPRRAVGDDTSDALPDTPERPADGYD